MLIKKAADLRYSDITLKSLYLNRRKFLASAASVPAAFLVGRELVSPAARAMAGTKLTNVKKSALSTTGEKVSFVR